MTTGLVPEVVVFGGSVESVVVVVVKGTRGVSRGVAEGGAVRRGEGTGLYSLKYVPWADRMEDDRETLDELRLCFVAFVGVPGFGEDVNADEWMTNSRRRLEGVRADVLVLVMAAAGGGGIVGRGPEGGGVGGNRSVTLEATD